MIKIVSNQLLRLFGEVGSSKTHFWVHSYDQGSKKGLVECRFDSVNAVRAAFASLTEYDSRPLSIYTVGVSGTMKTAKTKWL